MGLGVEDSVADKTKVNPFLDEDVTGSAVWMSTSKQNILANLISALKEIKCYERTK